MTVKQFLTRRLSKTLENNIETIVNERIAMELLTKEDLEVLHLPLGLRNTKHKYRRTKR